MICHKCNASIPDDSKFCTKCGSKLISEAETSSGSAFKMAGDLSCESPAVETVVSVPQKINTPEVPQQTSKVERIEEVPTHEEKKEVQAQSTVNYVALGVTIVCIILWLVGPFMTVNLFTWGDQPTALELMQDEVLYLGDLSESTAFQVALASIIGIAICFICVLAKSKNVTRIAAACTLLPLLKGFIDVGQWVDDAEEFMEFFGIGYWGIAVCLVVLLFLGGQAQKSS